MRGGEENVRARANTDPGHRACDGPTTYLDTCSRDCWGQVMDWAPLQIDGRLFHVSDAGVHVDGSTRFMVWMRPEPHVVVTK